MPSPTVTLPPTHPPTPPCSPTKKDSYDFVVVASGLYSNPKTPDWAVGKLSEAPPAKGPWILDARDYTDEKVAKVSWCGRW